VTHKARSASSQTIVTVVTTESVTLFDADAYLKPGAEPKRTRRRSAPSSVQPVNDGTCFVVARKDRPPAEYAHRARSR
jgi:hypothetical protein